MPIHRPGAWWGAVDCFHAGRAAEMQMEGCFEAGRAAEVQMEGCSEAGAPPVCRRRPDSVPAPLPLQRCSSGTIEGTPSASAMKKHHLLRVARRSLQTAAGSEQQHTSFQGSAFVFSLPFWREYGLAISSWVATFGGVAYAAGTVVSLHKDVQKERELREKERELREKDVQKERELREKDVQKERELRETDVQKERELRETEIRLAIATASDSSRVKPVGIPSIVCDHVCAAVGMYVCHACTK